jgi:hypothetical protein
MNHPLFWITADVCKPFITEVSLSSLCVFHHTPYIIREYIYGIVYHLLDDDSSIPLSYLSIAEGVSLCLFFPIHPALHTNRGILPLAGSTFSGCMVWVSRGRIDKRVDAQKNTSPLFYQDCFRLSTGSAFWPNCLHSRQYAWCVVTLTTFPLRIRSQQPAGGSSHCLRPATDN